MELPRGVTGFRSQSDSFLPNVDLRAFRQHCVAAARELNGSVLEMPPPETRVANFAAALIHLPFAHVTALINCHFPFLAFADPTQDGETVLTFRDCPKLADAISRLGSYTVLTCDQLTQALTEECWRNLAAVEKDQIRYWKPARIGDVIYNFWD
jgi:hypothetical protein